MARSLRFTGLHRHASSVPRPPRPPARRRAAADAGEDIEANRRPALRRSWNGEASLGVNRLCAKVRFTFLMCEGRAVKTATDRAADAIEAAETMFADEMGATLDLSPAVKAALMATIAVVIEDAVAEEREK